MAARPKVLPGSRDSEKLLRESGFVQLPIAVIWEEVLEDDGEKSVNPLVTTLLKEHKLEGAETSLHPVVCIPAAIFCLTRR